MITEEETPIEDRFLMILGKLSNEMIRQIEEEQMPPWRERKKNDSEVIVEWDRFIKRNRATDNAYFAIYSYADIPVGRRYNCFFNKNQESAHFKTDCVIEYAIFDGRFPVKHLCLGHKHILFLRFNGDVPDYIPAFERWEDIVKVDWTFGLCDLETFKARSVAG